MPLTSVARVKRMLQIPAGTTQHDTLIQELVDSSNNEVEDVMNLPAGVTQQVYNESIDIDQFGQNEIALQRYPVQSVAALTDADSLVAVADYYFVSEGFVRLIPRNAFFTVGRQVVDISYQAGYPNGEFNDEVQSARLAATMLAAQMFNEGAHVGFKSERIGRYGYTMAGANGEGVSMSPTVRRILARYRRAFVRENAR